MRVITGQMNLAETDGTCIPGEMGKMSANFRAAGACVIEQLGIQFWRC